jgi:hypothetical protein
MTKLTKAGDYRFFSPDSHFYNKALDAKSQPEAEGEMSPPRRTTAHGSCSREGLLLYNLLPLRTDKCRVRPCVQIPVLPKKTLSFKGPKKACLSTTDLHSHSTYSCIFEHLLHIMHYIIYNVLYIQM